MQKHYGNVHWWLENKTDKRKY